MILFLEMRSECSTEKSRHTNRTCSSWSPLASRVWAWGRMYSMQIIDESAPHRLLCKLISLFILPCIHFCSDTEALIVFGSRWAVHVGLGPSAEELCDRFYNFDNLFVFLWWMLDIIDFKKVNKKLKRRRWFCMYHLTWQEYNAYHVGDYDINATMLENIQIDLWSMIHCALFLKHFQFNF